MRGIKVTDSHLEAKGKKVILNILIKVEIPDKVEHQDILREFGATVGGKICRYRRRLKHISPHSNLKSLCLYVLVEAHNLVVEEV